MSDLKPCPFCGGEGIVTDEAWVKYLGGPKTWFVYCKNKECEISRDKFKSEKAGILWWNNRSGEDAIIDRAVKAIEKRRVKLSNDKDLAGRAVNEGINRSIVAIEGLKDE